MKTYKIINESNLPESELEIEVEVSADSFSNSRTKALKKLSETISVQGFRQGHVPENIVVQKVGEPYILEEAAYNAIESNLPEILSEKKIVAVGEPRISITKMAVGNPLQFKITVSVLPEVKLPDYKKIASSENSKETEEISVSEKELNDFIENVRKSFAQNSGDANDADKKEKTLPEVNDEFVKKLGDFKDVEDFRNKLKENLLYEKKRKAHDKIRLKISEAILDKTSIETPKSLVESELARMMARFHDDVTRMGMKPEEYLKQAKKTEDDIRKEWRPDAIKNAKLQIILNAIAEKEKIEAPKEDIDHEVKHLTEDYKDVDPKRAHAYVSMMLTNEKVFEFLESQK